MPKTATSIPPKIKAPETIANTPVIPNEARPEPIAMGASIEPILEHAAAAPTPVARTLVGYSSGV